MQIQQALNSASLNLSQSGNESESPGLDAELLLAHVLNKSREFLLTWPETDLKESEHQSFLNLLNQRALGQPIAYLIGKKAFWDFDLAVSPAVLIPRPETELLVELALEKLDESKHTIADLGTGSGAIALALAKERPQWQIIASDKSTEALKIARLNAEKLQLENIHFKLSNWCESLGEDLFDAIISNPPYIEENDPHLGQGDVRFEPAQALVAGEKGLADIKLLAKQAGEKLKPGALLLLEHGYQQAEAVRQILKQSGYQKIQTHNDLAGLERVSMARK